MNVAPMSHVINKAVRSMRIRKLEHTWSKEVVGRSYLLNFFSVLTFPPLFSLDLYLHNYLIKVNLEIVNAN